MAFRKTRNEMHSSSQSITGGKPMSVWWKDAVVYQIYPKSFQDSNGDGIGDLPGILSRLDYLKDLGIDVIWLSPVYRSPNDDNGYDISDYRDINPEYGTMRDMEILIEQANNRGIRIIMDLVINHTSDEHEWFVKSREKNSPYRDYYFWREGRNGKAPNNWTSFFGEDAWQKDDASGEYYLHLFSKKQPDLNYYNPAVLEEIKNIMRFWLDKGIAGFRCDVINILWKSSLEDGKLRLILTGREHYISQDGVHRILQTLRKEVLSYYDCFMVGETVFVTPRMGRDLCDESRGELDMIFSFQHMECDQIIVKWFKTKFHPKKLFRTLTQWQNQLPWNTLYFENHDQPRSVSRFGDVKGYYTESAKLLAMLLLLLRGTPFIFQGQELGMTNFDFTAMEDIADIESKNIYSLAGRLGFPKSHRWKMIQRTGRDNARTPMQWSAALHAGFTSGPAAWIKINSNHTRINMEAQQTDNRSILAFYKQLLDLRKNTPVLREGSFREVKISKQLFVFERTLESSNAENVPAGEKITSVIVLINLGKKPVRFPCQGKILLSNLDRISYDGTLAPYQGVLIQPV
jgi:oligo-1,6-glucosidase